MEENKIKLEPIVDNEEINSLSKVIVALTEIYKLNFSVGIGDPTDDYLYRTLRKIEKLTDILIIKASIMGKVEFLKTDE